MSDDFDFIQEDESEEETATSGNPKVSEAELSNIGALTPEIIAEARKLAQSKKGLEIDAFFKKYSLVNMNLDRLLHGKLKEDGSLI